MDDERRDSQGLGEAPLNVRVRAGNGKRLVAKRR